MLFLAPPTLGGPAAGMKIRKEQYGYFPCLLCLFLFVCFLGLYLTALVLAVLELAEETASWDGDWPLHRGIGFDFPIAFHHNLSSRYLKGLLELIK